MRIEIQHAIEVDATPTATWDVLTDTGAYPDWNPFVRRLGGELREGATLDVEIAPPGGKTMTFRPTVLVAESERELRWLGHLLVRGLFDGEHRFRLESLPGGRTRFVQSEQFSGLLVRPLRRSLERTRVGFEQMNRALKAEVEARVAKPA